PDPPAPGPDPTTGRAARVVPAASPGASPIRPSPSRWSGRASTTSAGNGWSAAGATPSGGSPDAPAPPGTVAPPPSPTGPPSLPGGHRPPSRGRGGRGWPVIGNRRKGLRVARCQIGHTHPVREVHSTESLISSRSLAGRSAELQSKTQSRIGYSDAPF